MNVIAAWELGYAAHVTLRARRPPVGAAYGLQVHRAVHELSTVQANADAVATTQPKVVHRRLSVDAGTGGVELVLSCRRPSPETHNSQRQLCEHIAGYPGIAYSPIRSCPSRWLRVQAQQSGI